MYNILLVEDDKNIREMLVEYFSKRDKEKFNITLAENGLKGLDKAYENSYDLLLLDVMLPEMDGFTLCKEIRRYSDVPIMFITARTSEADMLNGYALGCDDYIVKPIALPVLMGLPSATLAWYKQPPAMRVCIKSYTKKSPIVLQ